MTTIQIIVDVVAALIVVLPCGMGLAYLMFNKKEVL